MKLDVGRFVSEWLIISLGGAIVPLDAQSITIDTLCAIPIVSRGEAVDR
jgi:hypothetical protein